MFRRAARSVEFLAEGPQVVDEALNAGADVSELFVSESFAAHSIVDRARQNRVPIMVVNDSVMRALSETKTPQGIVAVSRVIERSVDDLVGGDLVLVLADVRDPGNAGTLLRSAVAAGATGTVFTTGSVDPYHPKTVRASAGALFRIPIVRSVELRPSLASLRRGGARLLGAAAGAPASVEDLDVRAPVALVLGNEAWGLPASDRELLDAEVGVPMPGPAESLNVAVAGSILLFEVVRSRRTAEGQA